MMPVYVLMGLESLVTSALFTVKVTGVAALVGTFLTDHRD